MADTVYIYALKDSISSNIIRYIGATLHPKTRLAAHLDLKDGSREKNTWIRNLLSQKRQPHLIILTTCDKLDRRQVEKELIEKHKSEFLLNYCNNRENLFKNVNIL